MRHCLQLAAALLIAAPAAAQTTYRIAGRVVDASDGHPLRHATVTLFETPATNKKVAETETDDTGSFSIARLPAGKYRTQAAARGYITAAYDEHGLYSTAIVTGAGLDTESLTLRLAAAATVSGRVTDEAGEPIQGADIGLFRETNESGARRIIQFRNARTDDLGAYEILRLPPGLYFATVRAAPWYAIFPPGDASNTLGVAADVDPALNAVYPLTFYPAATDSSGAAALELKPGTRFHADFHLTPQPAAHLTVQLPAPSPGGPGNNLSLNIPQLQQKVFDSVEPVSGQRVQYVGQSLDIQGLAPGSYILRRRNEGPGSSRAVTVSGGGMSVDESAPPPAFGSVTLVLGSAADTKLPQIQRLTLRPADAGEAGQPGFGADLAGTVKDGRIVIPNVPPGDYRIQSSNGRWHPESITENGKVTPGARLHVTGEGQTATVTFGNGSAAITGFVRRASGPDSKPNSAGIPGAMVVLIPASGDYSPDLYRRDQSDLDGSFRFADVLPSNYLLVAIQDGWTLEWGKPEAMAPYLRNAIPVIIPSDSHGSMPIAEPVPPQPR